MAEEVIGLLFGVDGGGAIDGRSGQRIVKDLTSIVNKINSGKSNLVPKIKFKFDTSEATKAVTNLKKQLKDIEKIASIKVTYSNGGKGTQGGSIAKELQAEMKQFVALQKQISAAKTKIGKLEIDGGDVNLISAYTQELERLESQYDKLMHTFMQKLTGNPAEMTMGDINDWAAHLESLKKIEEATVEAAKAKQQDAKDADTQQKKYRELSEQVKQYYQALKESTKLSNEYSYISAAKRSGRLRDTRSKDKKKAAKEQYGYVPDFTKRIKSINAAIAAFKELEKLKPHKKKGELHPNEQECQEYADRLGITVEQVKALVGQINQAESANAINTENVNKKTQDSWVAYASKVRDEVQRMYGTISKDSGSRKLADEIMQMASESKGNIGDLKDKFDEFRNTVHKSGADVETWGDKFKKSFAGTVRSALAGAITGTFTKYLREVYQNVVKLDGAMTDLQIASGKTREEVKELTQGYADLAKQLGATTTEVAEAADAWLRQGYSLEEANTLIKNSTMLSKLGQIEAAEASTALTSAMKGYKVSVEDSVGIVDKLTAVDMEAAASAGGIATAMAETATSADIAGVSMDKLIGYIATVKEVTQDADESIGKQNCLTIQ